VAPDYLLNNTFLGEGFVSAHFWVKLECFSTQREVWARAWGVLYEKPPYGRLQSSVPEGTSKLRWGRKGIRRGSQSFQNL